MSRIRPRQMTRPIRLVFLCLILIGTSASQAALPENWSYWRDQAQIGLPANPAQDNSSLPRRNEAILRALDQIQYRAQSGDAEAMLTLFEVYRQGKYIPQDKGVAFYWLQKAVDAASPQAMTIQADLYMQGKELPVNTPKAVQLIQSAADKGFPPAQAQLGYLYWEGIGVAQNIEKSRQFLTLAAEQNNASGQYWLAQFEAKTGNSKAAIDW